MTRGAIIVAVAVLAAACATSAQKSRVAGRYFHGGFNEGTTLVLEQTGTYWLTFMSVSDLDDSVGSYAESGAWSLSRASIVLTATSNSYDQRFDRWRRLEFRVVDGKRCLFEQSRGGAEPAFTEEKEEPNKAPDRMRLDAADKSGSPPRT
jgi:hypothetical protein